MGLGLNVVFVVGMAGSGKSLLTGTLVESFKLKNVDAIAVNFDPGAVRLPYSPDIDIRDYIDLQSIMEDYGLGPNGALILASDLIGDHLEEIRGELEDVRPEVVAVDTPGQIELFAFRESGPYIVNEISEGPKAVIYLLDGPFCAKAPNLVSSLFMAAAVYSRLRQPQVYALTKKDLMSEGEVDRVLAWFEEPSLLDEELAKTASPTLSLIGRELMNALHAAEVVFEPIPVSSKTQEGFVELNAALTRTITRGEEPTGE